MDDLHIDLVPAAGVVRVVAAGEIDLATRQQFAAAMSDALACSPHVVVDLGLVTFLDSQGVHALIAAQATAEERGGSLTVRRPQPSVRRSLLIAGLLAGDPIRPS